MFMKYGEVTSVSEHTNRESREIELHGDLQKRNRKGFYQNRYFRTSGVLLSYYTNKEAFDKDPLFPKASFKFTDMTAVQLAGEGKFLVSFSIASLELELKAVNESHAIHWLSFIRAKINLYSVNMLLTLDNSSTISNGQNLLFVTTTFRQLMLLKPSDQDSYNETSLNDHFEAIFSNRSVGKLSADELCTLLLGAAHKSLDDFEFSCEECEVEFRTRNPRVVAHCREYMRRYTKLLCGRIILELSSVLGPTEDTNQLAPLSVLAVICFLERIQQLSRFSFLPSAELSGIFINMKSLDYMCDTFVYICHSGLRYWLGKVAQLQPRQQGKILSDIPLEIDEKVDVLRTYKNILQEMTYYSLLKGTTSSMLSELHDFLVSFSFDDFSDEALTDHIVACYKIDQYAAGACRTWTPKQQASAGELSPAACAFFLSAGVTDSDNAKHPAKQLLEISDACRRNAMRAAATCVGKILPALQELLHLFFYEGATSGDDNGGWIGGSACKALLLRMSSWIDGMKSSVPREYLVLVKAEAYRFAVVLYYSTFIGFYKANKKAKLSAEGVDQVTMDLRLIEMWIAETGVCAECEPLKEIIKKMRLYLTCESTDLLVCFSGSVQDFASDCPIYAYDLFRVAMKLRDDVPPDYRRRVLGMCTEYLTQFKYVYEKTYGVSVERKECDKLSGSDYFSNRMSGESILSEIMPLVGVEHCTGKKWSLEKVPSMTPDENIFITNLVTEVCHHIRMMRLGARSSITISGGRSSKSRSSAAFAYPVVNKGGADKTVVIKTSAGGASTKLSTPETGSNPFEDSNPFGSDEDESEAAHSPRVPEEKDCIVNKNSEAVGNVSAECAEPSPEPSPAVAAEAAPIEEQHPTGPVEEESAPRPLAEAEAEAGSEEGGHGPRALFMENVSYEGSGKRSDSDAAVSSDPQFRAADHAFRKSQVIYLHGDHFKELHESLKPARLTLTPFTGCLPPKELSPARLSKCLVAAELELSGGTTGVINVARDAPDVSNLPSESAESEDVKPGPSKSFDFAASGDDEDNSAAELEARCDTSGAASRAILAASYSSQYLLVSSENDEISECEREMVLHSAAQSFTHFEPTAEENAEDSDLGCASEEETNNSPLGRPVSSVRLDPMALFCVPPGDPDAAAAAEAEADSGCRPSKPSKPRKPSIHRENSATVADPTTVKTPYVVIYGPGSVLRKDLSLDSRKVKALPCGSIVGVYETTATVNSEGIRRVRASFRGVEGWTSFHARDGTTIIEPCELVEKSIPPPKPPKRKSVSVLSAEGSIDCCDDMGPSVGESATSANANAATTAAAAADEEYTLDRRESYDNSAAGSRSVSMDRDPEPRMHSASDDSGVSLPGGRGRPPPKPPRKSSFISRSSTPRVDEEIIASASSPQENSSEMCPDTSTDTDVITPDTTRSPEAVNVSSNSNSNSNNADADAVDAVPDEGGASFSSPSDGDILVASVEADAAGVETAGIARSKGRQLNFLEVVIHSPASCDEKSDESSARAPNPSSDGDEGGAAAANAAVVEALVGAQISPEEEMPTEMVVVVAPTSSATDADTDAPAAAEAADGAEASLEAGSEVSSGRCLVHVDSVADSLLGILDSPSRADAMTDTNSDANANTDADADASPDADNADTAVNVAVADAVADADADADAVAVINTDINVDIDGSAAAAPPPATPESSDGVQPLGGITEEGIRLAFLETKDDTQERKSTGGLKGKERPLKPLKRRDSNTSMSEKSSPTRHDNKPEKPRKGLHPTMPVANLYSPFENEQAEISPMAVAVAVSMPQEMEVLDPATMRRGGSDAHRRGSGGGGPRLLSRTSSLNKNEEKVDHYNPFDDDDDDDDDETNGAVAAPNSAGSSVHVGRGSISRENTGNSATSAAVSTDEDATGKKKPKRRKSKLRTRLSALLHLGRKRLSSGDVSGTDRDSAQRDSDVGMDTSTTSRATDVEQTSPCPNPFADDEDEDDVAEAIASSAPAPGNPFSDEDDENDDGAAPTATGVSIASAGQSEIDASQSLGAPPAVSAEAPRADAATAAHSSPSIPPANPNPPTANESAAGLSARLRVLAESQDALSDNKK
jgi:hypothetical protein